MLSRNARRIVGALVVGGGAVSLLGCSTPNAEDPELREFSGSYEGPPITLEFWNGFTGGDGPYIRQMIEDFEAENPDIDIRPTTQEWGDLYQKLPAASFAGAGPDVGVIHVEQIGTMVVRNVIVPLDDLAAALDLDAGDFSEQVWEAGEYEGDRYGIPLDVHSLAMFYNTEHFEAAGITEPPTDAESFQEALAALQAAGYENPFWMPSLWPAHLIDLSLLWQGGGEPYSEDGGEATWGSAEGVAGLEWMRSMVDDGYSPDSVAIDAQYVAFKNGENSITWDGIWQINDLTDSGLPFAAAPVPAIGGEPAVWANSHQFVLGKHALTDADRADAAKTFIAWMSENSAEWAKAGMIPARASVREETMPGSVQEPIAEQIDALRFLPSIPGVGAIQADTLEIAVATAMLGNAPAGAVLDTEAARASAQLQANLERFGE
ncbi:ABC transporter substrate-binding protein [Microbacterium sp. 179-I 3D4 NHS]|uniref:ABC transporter substrate-binding protein n=1 Tax=Microbacterium sp. 179-I 3D4 NHS TaxID=3142381 RepID=UPI00399FB570